MKKYVIEMEVGSGIRYYSYNYEDSNSQKSKVICGEAENLDALKIEVANEFNLHSEEIELVNFYGEPLKEEDIHY